MNTLFDVKITKLNVVESFDTAKLPESSVRYVIQYGFNKSINDAHASIKRVDFESDAEFEEAVREVAYKRVEQIMSGNVPGTRGPADPKAATARKLARELEAAGVDATSVTDEEAMEIAKIFARRRAKSNAAHVAA